MLHKKRPLPEDWVNRKVRNHPEIKKYICRAHQGYWGDESATEEFSPDEMNDMYKWIKRFSDAFWVVTVRAVK